MNKKKLLLFILLVITIAGFLGVNQAYADIGTTDPIYQKAFYAGVKKCFESTASIGGLKNTITISDFDGSINSLIENDEKIVKRIGLAESDFFNEAATMSCKVLLSQWVTNRIPVSTTSDLDTKKARLENAEYTEEASSGIVTDDKCYQYTYVTNEVITGDPIPRNTLGYSNNLCIAKNASGNFVSSVVVTADGSNDVISFSKTGTDEVQLKVKVKKIMSTETKTHDYDLSSFSNEAAIFVAIGNQIATDMGSSLRNSEGGWIEYVGGLAATTYNRYAACQAYSAVGDNGIKCDSVSGETIWVTAEGLSKTFASSSDLDTIYKKHAMRNTADFNTVIKNFSNSAYDYNGIKFSDDEKYSLYTYYLEDIYGVDMSNIQCADVALSGAGDYQARLWDGSKYTNYCYFNASNTDKKVNGVFDDGIFGKVMTFNEVLAALNGLSNTTVPTTPISTSQQNSVSISGNSSSYCEEAGIKAVSWILCPAAENMEYTASTLDNLVEGWLSVDSDLYNSTSPTYGVWEIMRNIANVVIIIVLLVIIFSQLTGYGIDNYGIKRMLPKLIAGAILLNLSFIICELAVDISNIAGVGLRNLFGSIGNEVAATNPETTSILNNFIGNVVTGIFAAGGIAGAASATVITIGTAIAGGGVMAVIIVVLALLVVVFAILLFFIMLGARMIIIIGCIAIAPIAFSLYILPNTQKLFKKWWDMFKAALIVFPICGALGGISYLVKAIVLTVPGGANLPMLVIALIAPYLVFFLLPTLLKSSISALGVVGGALTSMGNSVRGGLKSGQSAVMNTDSAKATMQEGRMNILRRRVGMGENNQLTDTGIRRAERAKRRGGARLKLYSAQLAQVKKDAGVKTEAESSLLGEVAKVGIATADALPDSGSGDELGTTFGAHTEGAYYGGKFLDAASTGDITSMNAAIEAMKKSGMKTKDIAKLMRYAQNHGYYNSMDADTRAAWMRDLYQKHGNDVLATDFELKHFMRSGGSANNGTLGAFGDYAKAVPINIDELNPEDVLKLSGDSMAALISAGTLDQGMAQRVMAMNPNMSADKRIMLGAAASGAVGAGVNASTLKSDAEKLARNRKAGSSVIIPTGSDTLETQVARWTAPTAQRTTVVQEFFGEEDKQIRPIEVSYGAGSTEQQALEESREYLRRTAAATEGTNVSSAATAAYTASIPQMSKVVEDISKTSATTAAAAELGLDAVDEGNDQLKAINWQLQQHSGSEVDHVRGLSDQDLDNLINDPNIPDNDPTKQAGHREHARRNSSPPLT